MVTDKATEKELTQKQERFCIEYYRTGEGTQSAITAGYSRKSATVIASLNLAKPEIKARRQRLRGGETKLAIADVEERKEMLTEVYRFPLPDKVSAKERVMAIAEHNKMGGDYAPERHAVLADIVIEVVYGDRNKAKEKDTGTTPNPSLPSG